jgi:hypothetical protein
MPNETSTATIDEPTQFNQPPVEKSNAVTETATATAIKTELITTEIQSSRISESDSLLKTELTNERIDKTTIPNEVLLPTLTHLLNEENPIKEEALETATTSEDLESVRSSNLQELLSSINSTTEFIKNLYEKRYKGNENERSDLLIETNKVGNIDEIENAATNEQNQSENERMSAATPPTEPEKEVSARSTNEKVQESLECSTCEATFSSSYILNLHSQRVHNDAADHYSMCPICEEKFSGPTMLGKHVKTVHGSNIECFNCKRQFKEMSSLRRHIESVHADIAKCRLCPAAFDSKKDLEGHMIKDHNKSEPNKRSKTCDKNTKHNCSICNLNFKFISNLNNHLKAAHDNPVKCQECDRPFSSERSLKDHVDVIHGRVRPQDRPVFECDICGRSVLSIRSLRKHVKAVHQGLRRFECTSCPSKFAEKAKLEK